MARGTRLLGRRNAATRVPVWGGAEEARTEAKKKKRRQAEGRKKPGKPAVPPSDEPDPKAQRNFTDPESRIMKSRDGFIKGYNAQAVVDATATVHGPPG